MTRPIHKVERKPKKISKESKILNYIGNMPQKYIWISMAVLFICCFAWAFFSFGSFWSSQNVTVPNVVGKPVEVAQTTLKKLDLKVSVDEIASDDVPAGEVISQTPIAGTNVKAKRIIHLTVSKGGSTMLIPDLKGLTLSQVNIVINMKQKVRIPSVVGMTLSDAKNTLSSLKLAVGTITSSDGGSIDDASAVVVSQDPAAGETKSDTVVNLTVAAKQKAKKNGVYRSSSTAPSYRTGSFDERNHS